jgi:hypothetical protein
MRWALAALCAVVVACTLLASTAVASRDEGSAGHRPCLEARHLPAFTAYSLGASFDGLARTGESRSCFVPPPADRIVGSGPRSLAWTAEADYGTCTPEPPEGTCDIPLEIDSWPECDRNFGSYGTVQPLRALPAATSFRLSGSRKIPTVELEHGLMNRIEMYTGQTTIVIFAPGSEALAERAAHALARAAAPAVASRSAASLRAAAVSTRGCRRR